MYNMFKRPVERSLSYALGIDFLFAIEKKHLIHLTLNHVVFDKNKLAFL